MIMFVYYVLWQAMACFRPKRDDDAQTLLQNVPDIPEMVSLVYTLFLAKMIL